MTKNRPFSNETILTLNSKKTVRRKKIGYQNFGKREYEKPIFQNRYHLACEAAAAAALAKALCLETTRFRLNRAKNYPSKLGKCVRNSFAVVEDAFL